MARISLNDAMARPAAVDREKLDAATEEDIRRYQAEDGYADADVPDDARTVIPPRELRVSLGLTQREMAARLRVPFDTWRNWETGRVSLDPAVRSLLDLVAAFGERAFEALEQKEQKKEPSMVDRALRALAAEGFSFAPKTSAPSYDDEGPYVSRYDVEALTGGRTLEIKKIAVFNDDGSLAYEFAVGEGWADRLAKSKGEAKVGLSRKAAARRGTEKAT